VFFCKKVGYFPISAAPFLCEDNRICDGGFFTLTVVKQGDRRKRAEGE
jgi:hypothetical protein